jgi:predicted ATP-dependent serine protease
MWCWRRLPQPFAALRKLKDSQRTLPIAAYESTIVTAIKENQVRRRRPRVQQGSPVRVWHVMRGSLWAQVIIIAGDTGCGKSTQVPQVRV